MPVTSYSRTPANNNSAAPNGAPEGMSAGSVNNTIRQIMTDIVNEASRGQARVLADVAGTNTITASMSPDLDGYSAGMLVVFTPAATNTSTVTLNIDALGALDVQKDGGSVLAPGDLVAGVPAVLVLDSVADDFILLNPVGSGGTFTGTLTGCASNPSGAVNYRIVGNLCTLYITASIAGTSNASTLTMTGLPAACHPATSRTTTCTTLNQNTENIGVAVVSGSTITFFNGLTGYALLTFNSSGTKGLPQSWFITYPLI